jgi:hypothetical protein
LRNGKSYTNGTSTFFIAAPLITKKEGPKGPFSMTRNHPTPERLSVSQTGMTRLPSIRCHRTLTKGALATERQKKKGPFGPFLLQPSDTFLTFGKFDEGISTLTSPFAVAGLADTTMLINAPVLTASTTEQLSPGPSCLKSIACLVRSSAEKEG